MSDELQSVADAQAAYERARASGDAASEWDAAKALLDASLAAGRVKEAQATAKRMLDVARGAQDAQREAVSHYAMGRCFMEAGNAYRAGPEFERAAKGFAALGDNGAQAETLTLAVQARLDWGNVQRAHTLVAQGMNAARGLDRPDLDIAFLGYFGQVERALGNSDDAVFHLREAIELARRSGIGHGLPILLRDYGGALLEASGDPAEALAALSEAETLARATGDEVLLADTLNELALAAAMVGDKPRAHAALDEALALAQRMGDDDFVYALERNRTALDMDLPLAAPGGELPDDAVAWFDEEAALLAGLDDLEQAGLSSRLLEAFESMANAKPQPLQRLPRKTSPAVKNSPIYQIKATLRHVKPAVWRRFLVRSGISLRVLHDTLQVIMGWYDAHLHEFQAGGMTFSMPDVEWDIYGHVAYDEKRARLDQVVTAEGQKMRYLYDFGDNWEVDLLLEKVLPPDPKGIYPVCTKGKRHGPPDDSGGPWSYMDMLEIVKNPRHPDYEMYSEWLPEGYDAEEFDLAQINRELVRLQK